MSKAEEKQKTEAVTLLRDHTHNGEKKKAGDSIQVNEADKAWLVINEIISANSVSK